MKLYLAGAQQGMRGSPLWFPLRESLGSFPTPWVIPYPASYLWSVCRLGAKVVLPKPSCESGKRGGHHGGNSCPPTTFEWFPRQSNTRLNMYFDI